MGVSWLIRSRAVRHAVVLGAAMALVFSLGAGSAAAMTYPTVGSSTEAPWAVKIEVSLTIKGRVKWCSGSVIDRHHILTAAHCLRDEKGKYIANGHFVVTFPDTTKPATKPHVLSIYETTPVETTTYDVELLYTNNDLAKYSTRPLPLAPNMAVQNATQGVTLFAWGSDQTGTIATKLQKSQANSYFVGCPAPLIQAAGQFCFTAHNPILSAERGGDSGGPWVAWYGGGWVQIGAVHGRIDDAGVHVVGPEMGDHDVHAWIIGHDGDILPALPGQIVRDPATGTAWLTQADGFRHWIPTGADYNCFRTYTGATVTNPALFEIQTIPEFIGSNATCVPVTCPDATVHAPGYVCPSPQPGLTVEQETPNHPVNTFLNYHNASGFGQAIAAGQFVTVSCRVYDPTIVSVNPDGWWYRIHDAPWSDVYYAPANTFLNGDPPGGPYTHNTDFNVPVCPSPPTPGQ